jgi:thiamine biosynthesis lipoprotein
VVVRDVLTLGVVLLLSQPVYAQWFKREEPIMGTRVFVELWHEDASSADHLMQQVMDEMQRINSVMSPYLETSQLAQINHSAAQHPVKISHELLSLIQTANHYSEVSNGAFDITFASLGHRFDYRKGVKPTDSERSSATKLIDYREISLDVEQGTLSFNQAGMKIDLGGIAKGYAVDNGIHILHSAGVEHAIVTAGGDSRLLGDHRGRPWMLGIRHPRGEQHVITLPLSDSAVSTSGDYERYFEEDGVRYHHIIDPAKGDSARELLSVTILADRSIDADALSTAVFVLGREKGLKLVNSLSGISAILIDKTGKVLYSDDLVEPAGLSGE